MLYSQLTLHNTKFVPGVENVHSWSCCLSQSRVKWDIYSCIVITSGLVLTGTSEDKLSNRCPRRDKKHLRLHFSDCEYGAVGDKIYVQSFYIGPRLGISNVLVSLSQTPPPPPPPPVDLQHGMYAME